MKSLNLLHRLLLFISPFMILFFSVSGLAQNLKTCNTWKIMIFKKNMPSEETMLKAFEIATGIMSPAINHFEMKANESLEQMTLSFGYDGKIFSPEASKLDFENFIFELETLAHRKNISVSCETSL